ncbi:MAG: lysine exporter LysO family protein [Bacteroidales bacterium]|nr:lysine exporter LysO family protein [Bacteroidales bacterium]
MMGSIKVVVFFILGALLGYLLLNYATLPAPLANGSVTQWVLYLLMIQVGASIGSDKNLKEILKAIRPKMLLIPLGTIVGTLIFTAIAALFISKWGFFDSMAIGSGFAYYSLSSILITQLTEPSVGIQMATQLGTVALLANILREIYGLLGAPLFYRYFGIFAPICVGGATTMDTTLPIITSVCGKNLAFISIFHGILVDFSVPLLVSFFCSI